MLGNRVMQSGFYLQWRDSVHFSFSLIGVASLFGDFYIYIINKYAKQHLQSRA